MTTAASPKAMPPCSAAQESRSPTASWWCPTNPIMPFIEGDGTGPDIWRASVRVHRRGGREGLRRQAPDPLDGGLRRREGQQAVQHLAARGDRRGLPRVPGVDQGPAHHAGRRRHPLAQRRAAPDARPVRVPAPGALVQGRALPGQAPGEGRHGDLPREHRGHLRRHRVRGGHRPTTHKFLELFKAELPEGLRQDPLPGDLRHRHQAGLARTAPSG